MTVIDDSGETLEGRRVAVGVGGLAGGRYVSRETSENWLFLMFRVNRRSPNIGQIKGSLMFRAKH